MEIIVIDIGSYNIKVGFLNENKPRIIPTVIGRPRFLDLSRNICDKGYYFGEEAILKKGILKLDYPIENGLVNNWGDFELILEYIIKNELNINNTEDYSAIIIESPINSNKNKEEITKVIFETFNFQNLYIGIQQELTFDSFKVNGGGLKNGLIVDSGDNSTLIVPIINGKAVINSITQLKIGGKHITDYLFRLLNENGSNTIYQYDKYKVNLFKENNCYISLDPDNQQQQKQMESNLKLTDGQTIKFTNEVFKSPELLFNPLLNQLEVNSIQKSIYETIMKFNQKEEIQKDLFNNIILTGGNSIFNGFKERLEKELKLLSNESNINIIKVQDPIISSWKGGSMIQLTKFNSNCYTRLEYDEIGPSIIYSKQTIN